MVNKEKIDLTKVQLPGQHLVTANHKVDVYYPDHAERSESALFRHTKRKLHLGRVPCWICGTNEDLEVHHFHVEWAMMESVDWEIMKELHPLFNWAKFEEPEDFVDSEYNMMVLCQLHHRDEAHGIHSLPYPIWVMQKYKKKDYVLLVEDNPEYQK